jgi:hypothetical protein
MVTLLRTPFSILINESDVIPNKPVLCPYWGHGHQITFLIVKPYLILVSQCSTPWRIMTLSGKSICAMRSHLSSQSLGHWCSGHKFTGMTTTQWTFIKDNSIPKVWRISRGLKTPKGGPRHVSHTSVKGGRMKEATQWDVIITGASRFKDPIYGRRLRTHRWAFGPGVENMVQKRTVRFTGRLRGGHTGEIQQ